jgi:hypothetical protein
MGAASLFISHHRFLTGHEKGFVMKNCSTLLDAVAPLALMGALLQPQTVIAAETATAKPAPRIRTTAPVKIEKIPRTIKTIPEPEEKQEEAPVKAEQAESTPTPRVRNYTGIEKIEGNVAEVESTPRIRKRIAIPAQEDATTEPATPRIRRGIGTSRIEATDQAEVESTPRIRTRVAKPAEEDRTTEPATPGRVRVGTSRTDETTSIESRNTPYTRKRFATPASEPDTPSAEEQATQRRRGRTDANTPEADPVVLNAPPRLARIDDDGGSAIPRNFVGKTRPGTVILKPGSNEQILSSLEVIRTLDLATLTANPTMTLGATTFDFNPMLQNPKSIPNIAKNLRKLSNLVDVRPNTGQLTAYQTDRGFVVRSELAYGLKPGACRTAANRALIANAGISCFIYKDPNTRDAAFSNPEAVEYVENPAARANAIAEAHAQAETTAADIAKNIAEFRNMLKDPAQRGEMTASVGESELARMEQLDDTALAGELANLHDVAISETGFMPIFNPNFVIDPTIFADRQRADKLVAADKQLAAPTEPNTYDIPDEIFLTGFTLGSKDEWRKGISTTIKWCFIGCKRTYYVEAWAGFEYGFGLRFPMKFGGTYNYVAGGLSANLNPLKLTMFDGNADDYRKAGLKEDLVFNGKEFVAQFGANAGFAANLPFLPLIKPPELNPKFDFTELDEFPWKGGNVTPPNKGEDTPPKEVFFRQVDLLNNIANLGFVSVKIHPGVQVSLSSDDMSLTVNGTKIDNKTKDLALPMDGTGISSFTAKDPFYNIGLTLTPGLEARLTLDLAVWSNSLEWPVWFSAAKITWPPGGKTFSCHEGTSCSRDFMLSRDGAVTPFRRDLKNWGLAFDAQWLPKCLDAICTTSVKLKRYDTVEWGFAQEAASPDITMATIATELSDARNAAAKYYDQSVLRKAQKSSDTSSAMGNFAQAIYTPQCKDSLCADNVAALAAQMGPTASEATKLDPTMDAATVNKMVNKEFGPKFVAEVDASKMRVDMKNAKSVQEQLGKKGKMPILRTN